MNDRFLQRFDNTGLGGRLSALVIMVVSFRFLMFRCFYIIVAAFPLSGALSP